MAEIVPVVSEALEAQVRDLLPSQRGFGEDLQASNVITPIIDLTAVAQGTNVPEYQAQAIAFGSQTAFSVTNTTTTLANAAGFWRIFANSAVSSPNGTTNTNALNVSDGSTSTQIWAHSVGGAGGAHHSAVNLDFIVFLPASHSLIATSTASSAFIIGSYRQVADVNGNIVNPVGFTPQ